MFISNIGTVSSVTKVNFFPKYSIVQRDTSPERSDSRNSAQKADSNRSAQKADSNRSAQKVQKESAAKKVKKESSRQKLKKERNQNVEKTSSSENVGVQTSADSAEKEKKSKSEEKLLELQVQGSRDKNWKTSLSTFKFLPNQRKMNDKEIIDENKEIKKEIREEKRTEMKEEKRNGKGTRWEDKTSFYYVTHSDSSTSSKSDLTRSRTVKTEVEVHSPGSPPALLPTRISDPLLLDQIDRKYSFLDIRERCRKLISMGLPSTHL